MCEWPAALSSPLVYLEGQFHTLLLDFRRLRTLFEREEDDLYLQMLSSQVGHASTAIRRAFVDRITSGLCRLADPMLQHGQTNLSLERVFYLVRERGNDDLAVELDGYLLEFREAIDPLVHYRNKLVAHLDEDVALDGRYALPIAPFYESFELLKLFFGALRLAYLGQAPDYDLAYASDDVERMLQMMADSEHARARNPAAWLANSKERLEVWGEVVDGVFIAGVEERGVYEVGDADGTE